MLTQERAKISEWLLRDSIACYLNGLLKAKSIHTQRAYKRYLMKFAESGPEHAKSLTVEHVEMGLDKILKSGLKPQSVNAHIAGLQAFTKWLHRVYGLPDVAADIPYLKGQPPVRRILSKTEYEQVLRANQGFDADIIKLLSNTGLRASEMLTIRPTDIQDDLLLIRQGKGQKERYVPLNSTALAILSKYTDQPQNTFYFSKSYRWLQCLFIRVAKKAHLEPFSAHSMRHYFATDLLNHGVSIADISQMLGHSSILTTQIYLHFTERTLRGVTRCLDE